MNGEAAAQHQETYQEQLQNTDVKRIGLSAWDNAWTLRETTSWMYICVQTATASSALTSYRQSRQYNLGVLPNDSQ